MNNLKCGNSPGLLVSGPPLSSQYLRRSRFGGWGKGTVSCLRSFNRIYNSFCLEIIFFIITSRSCGQLLPMFFFWFFEKREPFKYVVKTHLLIPILVHNKTKRENAQYNTSVQ